MNFGEFKSDTLIMIAQNFSIVGLFVLGIGLAGSYNAKVFVLSN